jgi:hypothetical protein
MAVQNKEDDQQKYKDPEDELVQHPNCQAKQSAMKGYDL